jgi:HK97 family phage prohead protease
MFCEGYESKSFGLSADIEDVGAGVVHAVVSVFGNKDLHGEVVCRGAFARSLEEGGRLGKLPPGVFHHDWTRPVAKTLRAWEAEDGLHVVGQFNLETQRGRETFSDIKAGIITEYSFGFRVVSEKMVDGARHLTDVEWLEWSPVLIGANRLTYTAGVKGVGSCAREAVALDLQRLELGVW